MAGEFMHKLRPLAPLPPLFPGSPRIVQVLDAIRFELWERDDLEEFRWFIREYPRVYRYHVSNIEHRLTAIHRRYQHFHEHFAQRLAVAGKEVFQEAISTKTVLEIYWDFEALLNAMSSALDAIARILTTAFLEHTPPSFNKLIGKAHLGPYVAVLLRAKQRWVQRLKDYRDCFVHYTSVDTHLSCSCTRYQRDWQVRCKLPSNPNARDIIEFRWSRRHDVLTHAIAIWRHFVALDRKIAGMIHADYRAGTYPVRAEHLFSVGQRMFSKKHAREEPVGSASIPRQPDHAAATS
jgi:hypothetical protein